MEKVLKLKREDLEAAVRGMTNLKPQVQMLYVNGGMNKKEKEENSKAVGKDFDTAITAMLMCLNAFPD